MPTRKSICRRFAVALMLVGAASAATPRRVKVMQTEVRGNLAHLLVYTTDAPRTRIVLACHLDMVGCKVPTAGDTGMYLPDNDGAIYEGPNACIGYDYPGDSSKNTGCYSVQSSSVE